MNCEDLNYEVSLYWWYTQWNADRLQKQTPDQNVSSGTNGQVWQIMSSYLNSLTWKLQWELVPHFSIQDPEGSMKLLWRWWCIRETGKPNPENQIESTWMVTRKQKEHACMWLHEVIISNHVAKMAVTISSWYNFQPQWAEKKKYSSTKLFLACWIKKH